MVSVENNINMSTSSCLRCGRCCTSFGVCITPSDIKRIAEDTGLDPASFVSSIPEPPNRERTEPTILINNERSLIVLKWKKNPNARVCIFYRENDNKSGCPNLGNGCSIYDSRPLLCRSYPFRKIGRGLCDMKSRACPNRWSPKEEEKDAYLADLARYEKELESYRKIAEEWNKSHKGGLAEFLAFIPHFNIILHF